MNNFDPSKIVGSLDKSQYEQMEKMADTLIKIPHANPVHVQELIWASSTPGLLGTVAYSMICLYAIGKIEFVPGDPWTGKPGGWQAVTSGSEKCYNIN